MLSKILKKLLGDTSESKRIQEIEANTKNLIESKSSDVSRWAKNEELFENWNERTTLMAKYIDPTDNVIEFGAGVMYLKKILPSTVHYTPSDIVKRYEETLVCDLNQSFTIDLTSYNVAVFSGVLEYVYDVDAIVKQLKENNISKVLLSYCCADIILLSRLKNGWLSDYTQNELEAIFEKYNYKIEAYQLWNKQSVYYLKLG